MLRIRLTRTGKKKQPSYRIVVAEHSKAVKRQYLELLGQYIPATKPKFFTINKDRVTYWLSKGAQPSDTMATLLKKEGFADMDKFIGNRELQRKKKKEAKAEAPAKKESAAKDEVTKKDAAPAKEETPAEAPKEEAKTEKPAEEAPAKEEAKKEEVKEEAPAEPAKAEPTEAPAKE